MVSTVYNMLDIFNIPATVVFLLISTFLACFFLAKILP